MTATPEMQNKPKLALTAQSTATTGPHSRLKSLVTKLTEIVDFVDDPESINKLSATLVNVIMMAKPMVPERYVSELYKGEPAAYKPPKIVYKVS